MFSMRCLMVLFLLSGPTMAHSESRQWHAITLYPPAGVYHAEFLTAMVTAVESLWQVHDDHGHPILESVDSIASMNVIVAENEDVRFRRIIELQELDTDGLQRMRALVDVHPLVQRRLVTTDGLGTHLWLQVQKPVAQSTLSKLTAQLQRTLTMEMDTQCYSRTARDGALANQYFTQWHYRATSATTGVQALKTLAVAQQRLRRNMQGAGVEDGQYYSALNFLEYLSEILEIELWKEVKASGDSTISQIYLLADSLRNRDLQDLASPDFRQLQMVVLGHHKPLPAPPMEGYQLTHTQQWHSNASNYHVLDCRPNTTLLVEN
ncbi:MAG: hypothetical protein IBX52_05405 [Bacterioplanes sp.]|nr:hypothetical protein [Bacterioplanes sp.]